MGTSRKDNIVEIEGDCFYEQNPPFNFGGLDPEYSNFWDSWAVIVLVPYDSTTTYQPGTRNGPSQIILASQQLELYDEEVGIEICEKGICTLSPVNPNVSSPEKMVKKVQNVFGYLRQCNKLPVLVGGEHLVSVGAIRAFAEDIDLKVVHFDAHADLRRSYQGSEYSNACVMRLVSDNCDFITVGVRSISWGEHKYIKENNIRCVYARDVIENREKALEDILEFAQGKVYITIDLDVLDPSIMPAVGTPEPGGLGWYDLTYLLKHLCGRCEIVGFDVVELLPLPGNIAPDFLAAKLIYKMLAYSGYYLDKKINL